MKSFCFCIQKGGVGKTSLSVTLAAELAKHAPTILIDADPQGNASAWIGPEDALE
jgi:chromosome partitioning protein